MTLPRSLRVLLALGVVVLGLGGLLLLLALGEAALNIEARLSAYPPWVSVLWWGGLGFCGLALGVLVWRLLAPEKDRDEATPEGDAPAAPTEEELTEALDRAREAGVDTADIDRELAELRRRRSAGEVHVAMFGEISTGKSALVGALLPEASTQSDVLGGTTRELVRYRWHSKAGDRLLLTDMPGTSEPGGELDQLAREEAQRAHLVIFVTDSDLNRHQHNTLNDLLALGKPLILVLNKTDLYSREEAELLDRRLRSVLQGHAHTTFVRTRAATERTVIVQRPDGSETRETRPIAPDVRALARAMQRMIDTHQAILEQLRDSATFVLAHHKLDQALSDARRVQADRLVDGYAVKAVIGALAAVAPGSDLIIQGFLATQMIRSIAALYETKASKVDTELLLKLVQAHVGRAHTLLLAVAGNALKAFPGVGTLAGGALHAVAYGIIFRTLGKALARSLETRGEFHPRQTAKQFEETLGEDLESSARQLARLVIARARRAEREER